MARSVLEILLTVKDKASAELKKVDKQLDNVGNEAKKSGLNIEGFTKGLLGIGAAAAGIATTVGLAFRDIINDTVEYGKTVDDVSRALGTSTEEASKLIQIADDLRISQEQLKLGFRFALNEGVLPTIDGLKGLAEEYKSLPNATAKAQFAMDKFGSRAGLEMQKILELTSEQIDEMAASAEAAGLVLDEQAVQATKDFWAEVDNLNDSLEGLKITLGLGVIPKLIEYLDLLNQRVKMEMSISKIEEKIEKIQGKATEEFNNFRMTLKDSNKVYNETNGIMRSFMLGQIDEEQAMRQLDAVAKEHNITLQESFLWGNKVAQSTADLTDETENQITVFDDLTDYQNEIAAGYQQMGMTADEAKQAALDLTVATGEAARELLRAKEELEKARTVRFFDVDMGFGDTALEALKALDFRDLGGEAGASLAESIKQAFVTGAIDRPTADKYLEQVYIASQAIQVKLGEVDTEEAETNIETNLQKSGEEAKALLEAEINTPLDLAQFQQSLEAQFKALEDRKNMLIGAGEIEPNKLEITADPGDVAKGKLDDINTQLINLTAYPWIVEVQVQQSGNPPKPKNIIDDNRAGGGYVSPLNTYLVGERGPELFVPNTAGNIVSNNRLGAVARGGDTFIYNIFSAGAMKLAEAEAQSRRRARLNDSMGVG